MPVAGKECQDLGLAERCCAVYAGNRLIRGEEESYSLHLSARDCG